MPKFNQKNVLLGAASLVLVGLLSFSLGGSDETPPYGDVAERTALKKELLKEKEGDVTFGAENPEVRMVVYTDTECHFCDRYRDTLKELLTKRDDIQVTFRFLSIPIYPQSFNEARALFCAVSDDIDLESYHALSKKLFSFSSGSEEFTLFDAGIVFGGTDVSFDECFESSRTADAVRKQSNDGAVLGAKSVPTTFFYTDGGDIVELEGNKPLSVLESIIDSF